MMSIRTLRKPVLVAPLITLVVLSAAPWFGPTVVSFEALRTGDTTAHTIFWQLRVPQVALAFLVGAALGVSGMIFQAIFRNPLATPYTLGVASASSLAVVVLLYLQLPLLILGISLQRLAGFAGAVLATALLLTISRRSMNRSLASLLLAGVALGFLYSGLILLLQYLSSPAQGYVSMRWLMGSLETVGYRAVIELLLILLLVIALLIPRLSVLDLLAVDEDLAVARGVALTHEQRILVILGSLCVGAAVSVAGPIGFVGLIVPHVCRLLIGPSHRQLLPMVVMVAGSFLTACDTIARMVVAPGILPVGILTALCGVPFFLWLLFKAERS